MHAKMKSQISININKIRVLKLLVLACIVFLIGIKPFKSDHLVTQIIGILCFVISAVSFLIGINNMSRKRAVVVISPVNGIFDRRILNDFISWKEISHAQIVEKQNEIFLEVLAKHDFKLENFKILFRKTVHKQDGKVHKFSINLSMTDAKRSELDFYIPDSAKIAHIS
jgi:hypothetical protein